MKILNQICQLSRDAGSIIMKYYNSKKLINIFYKKDKTPVTKIDLESHNIIREGLLSITPDIPIISEENIPDLTVCQNWNQYWLIDPLDGTKEFLKNNGEFTVNISLIENGIPVLGVIYAPFFNLLYYAYKKQAWKEQKSGFKKKIHVSSSDVPVLMISRSHPDLELNNYLKTIQNYKIKKMGSSLKFCLLAEGKAQIYPRFGNTYIWDTAAGHALLNGSGGTLKTWNQKNLDYLLCVRSSFLNSGFFASSL